MRRVLVILGGFGAAVVIVFGSIVFLHEATSIQPTIIVATTTAPTTSPPVVKKIMHVATTTAQVVKEIVTPPSSGWKHAVATVFWVGEDEASDNGFIHNRSSAWDIDWEEHYGGVDDPEERCGFEPCAFVPEENPFYVALPYNDLARGRRKDNASMIPWNDPASRTSVLKNRWIAVRYEGRICYGQWQDVGPFEEDDVAYVFGDVATPGNVIGVGAGIDLSPALRDCLRADDVAAVEWRHVEADDVPDGPWRTIITTRK